MIQGLIDKITGKKRITVKENERVIAVYQGQILGFFLPGIHVLPNRDHSLNCIFYDLSQPVFSSVYEQAIKRKMPQELEKHVLTVAAGDNEVCIIKNGKIIYDVMKPGKECSLWKDAGDWSVQTISVPKDFRADLKVAKQLVLASKAGMLVTSTIESYETGILRIDGNVSAPLDAGIYYFWNLSIGLTVKKIDLRRQTLDIAGQELLTRDRVTIRINITADYTVVDPMLAVSAVKDYQAALYNLLQLTFRKHLGEMSLDQILDRKFAVGEETMATVRSEMKSIGLEVHNVDLKDVILPGEMRDIFNQVVAAEKQAEANVIRRREETNATRSLLNTAKVMADNPIMLRLKELESLEAIAAKVDHLTVHNGTEGLMNDLVKLRSDK